MVICLRLTCYIVAVHQDLAIHPTTIQPNGIGGVFFFIYNHRAHLHIGMINRAVRGSIFYLISAMSSYDHLWHQLWHLL